MMVKDINYEIIKELEIQKLSMFDISNILEKLNTDNHKYKFLSYLIDNKNVLFKLYELNNIVEEIVN